MKLYLDVEHVLALSVVFFMALYATNFLTQRSFLYLTRCGKVNLYMGYVHFRLSFFTNRSTGLNNPFLMKTRQTG